MKNNNSLEGYHLKLHMYYRVEYPSFWVFLEGLKNFDASVNADINDLVNGKEIKKRKKIWEAVQARKKTIVENYAPRNYLEYLQAIASTLTLFES